MDWRQFNHVALRRMQRMVREQARALDAADAWLAKYGRPPDDPLRGEVTAARRQLEQLEQWVMFSAKPFEPYRSGVDPYRPGVDPYKTRGLSAVLRADFQARGITEEQRD